MGERRWRGCRSEALPVSSLFSSRCRVQKILLIIVLEILPRTTLTQDHGSSDRDCDSRSGVIPVVVEDDCRPRPGSSLSFRIQDAHDIIVRIERPQKPLRSIEKSQTILLDREGEPIHETDLGTAEAERFPPRILSDRFLLPSSDQTAFRGPIRLPLIPEGLLVEDVVRENLQTRLEDEAFPGSDQGGPVSGVVEPGFLALLRLRQDGKDSDRDRDLPTVLMGADSSVWARAPEQGEGHGPRFPSSSVFFGRIVADQKVLSKDIDPCILRRRAVSSSSRRSSDDGGMEGRRRSHRDDGEEEWKRELERVEGWTQRWVLVFIPFSSPIIPFSS